MLGDTHGTEFGGDTRAYLAREYETHHRGGELQDHDLTGRVADGESWDERARHIDRELDGDHRPDEERDDEDDP